MDGSKMEYTEYAIKFTCGGFNRKWSFALNVFLNFSFLVLGGVRMLTSITHQRVACLPKAL